MIIKKLSQNEWEIKAKNSTIKLDDGIQVGEYQIPGTGEYEVAGVEVEVTDGITSIICEDLSIVFLTENKKALTEIELKKLSNVHILFLPVAGKNTMSVKDANATINEMEPSIIIPIYYDNLAEFSKLAGAKTETLTQLKIAKNTLPQEEERKIIILE